MRAPLLKDGAAKYALEIPGAGVLNTNAIAGLGGFGMSVGLAAAELLARTLLDRARPRDALFSARRFAPERCRP
jgi:glycine/D-amino acid oxidase-like deaminating enzyme